MSGSRAILTSSSILDDDDYDFDFEIEHKMGFDGDIIGGYDFGQFRA